MDEWCCVEQCWDWHGRGGVEWGGRGFLYEGTMYAVITRCVSVESDRSTSFQITIADGIIASKHMFRHQHLSSTKSSHAISFRKSFTS